MPSRVVIVPSIGPRLPSQLWGQCRHRQRGLAPFLIDFSLFKSEKWDTASHIAGGDVDELECFRVGQIKNAAIGRMANTSRPKARDKLLKMQQRFLVR